MNKITVLPEIGSRVVVNTDRFGIVEGVYTRSPGEKYGRITKDGKFLCFLSFCSGWEYTK